MSLENKSLLTELRGRVASLDGLRAISIAMVLSSHAADSCGAPEHLPSWLSWLFNGVLGVRVFFVISGFIITLLLLKEESAAGKFSIGKFYIRRIFRIIPVYYLLIITVIVISTIYHFDVTPADYIPAFTFTTGWWRGESWLLGHTWSLSVEEQFYLLWPAALLLVRTPSGRLWLLFAAIAAYPIMRIAVYLSPLASNRSYLFITQGDAILFGCLLAVLLFYKGDVIVKYLTSKVWLSRFVCLFLIALSNAVQSKAMMGTLTVPFSNTIEAASIAWLVGTFIFNRDAVYSLLNSRVFVFLGLISYSWYLWQQLFLFTCNRYFTGYIFTFPINIIMSLVVAIISYYLVEKNFERLKQRLMGKHGS